MEGEDRSSGTVVLHHGRIEHPGKLIADFGHVELVPIRSPHSEAWKAWATHGAEARRESVEVRSTVILYSGSVEWQGEKKARAACEGKPAFQVAAPPEFKGHAGIWSPEDLSVEAVNSCVLTTFLSFAEREALEQAAYRSVAEGRLERGLARAG